MVRTRRDIQGWAEEPSASPAIVAAPPPPPPPERLELDLEHFRLAETGLTVKGQPSFEEWESIGNLLHLMVRGIQWCVGDWLCYGDGEWGEKAAQVVDATKWSYETVRVYRWVAERVPPQNRFPKLPFKMHMVVAALSTSEQHRWLTRALEGTDGATWSVKTLEDAVRQKQLGSGAGVAYLVVVTCADEDDQAACARQLDVLSRKYTLKTEKKLH